MTSAGPSSVTAGVSSAIPAKLTVSPNPSMRPSAWARRMCGAMLSSMA